MARKNMAEIVLVKSNNGRLYCPYCRSHFEEEKLREEYKSLRFCSDCAGWSGVQDIMRQREEDRMEVFYELGMFDRKGLERS